MFRVSICLKKSCSLFLLLSTLLFSQSVFSYEFGSEKPKNHNIEFAVLSGIQFGGSYDFRGGYAHLDPGVVLEGDFAWYIKRNRKLVLSYFHQFTHITLTPMTSTIDPATFKANTGYVQFGGEADIPVKYRVLPFVGMSMGILFLADDIKNSKADIFFGSAIYGGLKIPFNKTVGLRFHFKMLITIPSGKSSSMCVAGYGCKVSVFVDTIFQGHLSGGLYLSF